MRYKKTVADYELLAKEWDYDKNRENPDSISYGANKYAYWICSKCGYQYKSKIANRTILGRGCPCCANRIIVAGVNDLYSTHPSIAAEWDIEKNGSLTPQMVSHGSGRKVWWKCLNCHNSYQATILHRTYKDGTHCPICNSGRQTSFAEQAIYYYVKQVYPDAVNRYCNHEIMGRFELDIFIPSIKLAIEYDGLAWHKNDKHDREVRKYKMCQENGIRLLRLKERIDDRDRDTADDIFHIDDMFEQDNLEKMIIMLLRDIDPRSNPFTRKNCNQLYSPVNVDIRRDEITIRNYMTEIKRSLASAFPDIAKEWHPTKNGTVTPAMVKPYSDVKYWWLCPVCGNDYKASVGHRVYGTECPLCSRKKVAKSSMRRVAMIDPQTFNIVKEFESITEAAQFSGSTTANITSVCKGNRKKAKGYIWEYV